MQMNERKASVKGERKAGGRSLVAAMEKEEELAKKDGTI